MSGYFVLVADQGQARTFRRPQKFSALEEADSYDNPRGRSHPGDLVTHRAGTTFTSMGSGQDAKGEGEDIRDVEADRFAKQLAQVLAREGRSNGDELILIAAPRFLGRLRKSIDSETARSVSFSIDKDLVKADTQRISEEIDQAFNT